MKTHNETVVGEPNTDKTGLFFKKELERLSSRGVKIESAHERITFTIPASISQYETAQIVAEIIDHDDDRGGWDIDRNSDGVIVSVDPRRHSQVE